MPEFRTDRSGVEQAVEAYIEGVRCGDVALVRSVFHPDARMCGYMMGHRVLGTPAPFFDDVEHGPSQESLGNGYRGRIVSIEIHGDAATAIIAEDRIGVGQPDGSRPVLDIIDSFHLLAVDGRWLIVNKLFHHEPV